MPLPPGDLHPPSNASIRYYGGRCDHCGRFVSGDDVVLSGVIGGGGTIYCPRCTPTPAPAEPTRDFPSAGAPNLPTTEGTQEK